MYLCTIWDCLSIIGNLRNIDGIFGHTGKSSGLFHHDWKIIVNAQGIYYHTGDLLGFVDARRKSSGNTLRSLGILENRRAICGVNLVTIFGNRLKIDWDLWTYWKIFGIVSPSLEDPRKWSGNLLPHRGSAGIC